MEVRRINLDGTKEQTLMKDPRETISALDYDPVHHRVKLNISSLFALIANFFIHSISYIRLEVTTMFWHAVPSSAHFLFALSLQ